MMSLRQPALYFCLLLAMHTLVIAEPLAVGADAPAVSGVTDTGETLVFSEVYKKGFTLVYFYPRADTPGCTAQGCSLRDSYEVLTKRGVTVIGVSTDTVEAQRRFKAHYMFPFTLVSDTDKRVMTAFGQEPALFASRQAFLIDSKGKVVWRDLSASTKQQAADVLEALRQLRE